MSVPIDPEQLTAADIGEKRATLEMDHGPAVEFVRECCLDAGFGVPVEFSPSTVLNEKVDADRDPYYVLGACNPEMANRALEETMKMGGLFPCNFVVWQTEPGVQQVYHVSIMKLARLVGIAPDNDAWEGIVDETGEMVEAAVETMRQRR